MYKSSIESLLKFLYIFSDYIKLLGMTHILLFQNISRKRTKTLRPEGLLMPKSVVGYKKNFLRPDL